MKAKYLLPLMGSLFMFSCATPVATKVSIPDAPKQTESALPSVLKTEENIEKVVASNQKLAEKAKTQEQIILDQKVKISEAMAQAARIQDKAKSKELVTELEALEMSTRIKAIENENFSLIKQNKKLVEDIDWQSEFLGLTKRDAADARYKLIESERELTTLRDNYKFAQKTVEERNEDVKSLQTKLTKVQKEAASAKVYRNWIIAGVSLTLIYFVGMKVLELYNPFKR